MLGVEVFESEEKGRGLLTRERIEQGKTILKQSPLVSVLKDRFVETRCGSCFSEFDLERRKKKKCSGCSLVYYCSVNCQVIHSLIHQLIRI